VGSPTSTVLCGAPTTCCSYPSHFGCPSCAGASRRPVLRSRACLGVHLLEPGGCSGCPPSPIHHARKQQAFPGSWGSSCGRALSFDPGALRHLAFAVPPFCLLPHLWHRPAATRRFRGSITRPTRSLCTLHGFGYPGRATLGSRLVASLCRGWIGYQQGSFERFRQIQVICFLLSQASPGAQVTAHPWRIVADPFPSTPEPDTASGHG
jgi:hypothetical protein